MTRRRVLWVSTSTETRGGVSTYVRTMQQSPLWESWDIRHVTTHRNGPVAARLAAFVRGAGSFLWELTVRRPQLVHLHMASYGSFARKSVLGWISWLVRVPLVIHVHGGEFHQFYECAPRLLRAYIRATLSRADLVIALGETWKRRLEQIEPRARIAVVPNAVSPRTPVAQPDPGEPVQVVFLGEISDHKGAFTLIEAWRDLVDAAPKRPGAHLLMAGGGAVERARGRVEELLLWDHVRVLGWVAPAQVEDLLRSSQVFVLPSRMEGQPMAMLEAMANGLCVIATDVGGIPDLVDSDCAVLIPVGDVGALATSLRHVIDNHEERSRLGAQALCRVRERFDVDTTWKSLDALYRQVRR